MSQRGIFFFTFRANNMKHSLLVVPMWSDVVVYTLERYGSQHFKAQTGASQYSHNSFYMYFKTVFPINQESDLLQLLVSQTQMVYYRPTSIVFLERALVGDWNARLEVFIL